MKNIKKRIGCLLLAAVIAFGCENAKEKESAQTEDANEITESADIAVIDEDEAESEKIVIEKEIPEYNEKYIAVDSLEGLNVRENPDLSATKVAVLTDKTLVKLLETGDEITIDGIQSNWLLVELPADVAKKYGARSGWVFGGYMSESPTDSVSNKLFNYFTSQTGIASIGSYIRPKKYPLEMYSAASTDSQRIGLFSGNDLGVIIRGYEDRTDSETCWYYILNQASGKKGWVESKESFYSTADGFELSPLKSYYTRKNADVVLERFSEHDKLNSHAQNIVLCADNKHYVARANDGENLIIGNIKTDEKKEVYLGTKVKNLTGEYSSNGRDSSAIFYSAKSNAVYFGWDDSVYAYSLDKDEISLVFKVNTEAKEALSRYFTIQDISVSKDEKFVFLRVEFETSRRYIKRMVAYNAQAKTQKIIDTVTPECDSDHYFDYGSVDFDENNNAIYGILNSSWDYGTHHLENAVVTVKFNSSGVIEPVLKMFPKAQYSRKSFYLPNSNDILCCEDRFCVYENVNAPSLSKPKSSYRFAENSIYAGLSAYHNFQFNADKSICAVLDGGYLGQKYLCFYSTKTFNLLFAMKLDSSVYDFWWNGKLLLLENDIKDGYDYSSFHISITEKEKQISDNEPMSKEQVGLCALTFRIREEYEYDGLGFKFSFSPNGLYFCENFFAMSEAEEIEQGVIGAYEVKSDNSVYLYPYFSKFSSPYNNNDDFSCFEQFYLQDGRWLKIVPQSAEYNRFGNIELYDDTYGDRTYWGSTYDWGEGGAYGVDFEEAAQAYQFLRDFEK